ncbi:hypothetical protein [Moraxella nasicaprae]|uniref:Uncharacterized protein n=1 Tax=Moraxella nasicaprae TaxID=2904122 RepID=A0ABY6F6B6_9GAMM|nr:hypothetical protein [Moraxella nasicaprae]UXZ05420.1 hypothetical protein LU297_02925 [Moraxella nasicaprae]
MLAHESKNQRNKIFALAQKSDIGNTYKDIFGGLFFKPTPKNISREECLASVEAILIKHLSTVQAQGFKNRIHKNIFLSVIGYVFMYGLIGVIAVMLTMALGSFLQDSIFKILVVIVFIPSVIMLYVSPIYGARVGYKRHKTYKEKLRGLDFPWSKKSDGRLKHWGKMLYKNAFACMNALRFMLTYAFLYGAVGGLMLSVGLVIMAVLSDAPRLPEGIMFMMSLIVFALPLYGARVGYKKYKKNKLGKLQN